MSKARVSAHEEKLAKLLTKLGYKFVRELRFDKPNAEGKSRKWRFDFAMPDYKIALEVEGGTWGRSRHTSSTGFAKDCEKYNAATKQGWQVYRLVPALIKEEYILSLLQ